MRSRIFIVAFVASIALLFAPAYAEELGTQEPAASDDAGLVLQLDDAPLLAEAQAIDSIRPGAAIDAPDTVAGTGAVVASIRIETEEVPVERDDMLRLYNPNSGEHFYTKDVNERDFLVNEGWNYEGLGWMAPPESELPVYRLYNPNAGDHHYTMAANERDHLVKEGWNYEGIGWYSALEDTGLPVLRRYNPNAEAGAHNFSTDEIENAHLVKEGWNDEGVAWHALASGTILVEKEAQTVHEKAPYLTASFTTDAGTTPETIVSYAKDDITYLFMPSYASLANVYLNAYTSKIHQSNLLLGSEQFVIVNPTRAVNLLALGAEPEADGTLKLKFKTESDGAEFPLVVMRSASVSTIFINSNDVDAEGRAYVEADPDHDTKANVAVHMLDPFGKVVYGKDALGNKKTLSTIKGRGNSTWKNGNKKPYQISLSSKTDLVNGGAAAKKWILLANSADPTLLHSSIAFNLAAELGLSTVDVRPVDLYYDGEYRGSYLLTEKVQIGDGRVEIADLEDEIEDANPGADIETFPTAQATNKYGNSFQYVAGVKDPESIEGGYLLELDNAYYRDEKCRFKIVWPGDGYASYFVLKSPEITSRKAVAFISEAVQEAFDNLALDRLADGFELADGSFAFDLDSFAKMYLLEEFLKNNDAYTSSTYFHLDRGSRIIYSGPVWDFDAGMGTRVDANDSIQSAYWGYYLDRHDTIMSDSVKKRIMKVFSASFRGLVKNVVLGDHNALGPSGKLHSLAWYASELGASQRMNEIPFGVTAFDIQAEPYETWDENLTFFENWLTWRLAWFSDTIDLLDDPKLQADDRDARQYKGFDYGFVFDARYYMEMNPSLKSIGVNTYQKALIHFANIGISSERFVGTSSRNFNVKTYMKKNPELAEELGDDLKAWYMHYCTTGFRQSLICI